MKEKLSKLTYIVFIIYVIILSYLILFKFATSIDMIPRMRNINLIPFGDSVRVNGSIYLKEIIYNILVFIPFGIYISFIKNNWSCFKKIIIGLSISFIFEVVQYIFSIGGSDITDLIDNTLGVILGLLIYKLFCKLFKNKTTKIINIIALIMEICFIGIFILLFLAN